MAKIKHFLDIKNIAVSDLQKILKKAAALKKSKLSKILEGKNLAMVFEKNSTRTRVSFEVGMSQLGGNALMLAQGDCQLGRGETIGDTAKTLSRYVDVIMYRTYGHDKLLEMAKNSSVPVINGLTDKSHPCQIMADILTFEEHIGSIKGKTLAWCGDWNNMTNSWVEAAEKFDFKFNVATPKQLTPKTKLPKNVKAFIRPEEAVKGADCVMTDTWVSMGDKNTDKKLKLLADYQVNDRVMSFAKKNAIFMHCLPAHREEEVTSSVIEGKHSVVWDEAENRLHVQKAIILWCLGKI